MQCDRADALRENQEFLAAWHSPSDAAFVNVGVNARRAGDQWHGNIHLFYSELIRLDILRAGGVEENEQQDHKDNKERQPPRDKLLQETAKAGVAGASAGWRWQGIDAFHDGFRPGVSGDRECNSYGR